MTKRSHPPKSPVQTRQVVIGDLNGADDALEEILRGTKVINRRGQWTGGRTELVQLGDIFNRGGGARAALALLRRLKPQARAAGGRVTVLLGNHEVMTALRNEAYCTVDEYLSFATKRELRAWPDQVARAGRRIYRDHGSRGPVLPLGPRLDAWKVMNAPGRQAMRRALGQQGQLGRTIRSLPVVYLSGGTVFTHAGIVPTWAKHGVDGLNRMAKAEWATHPQFLPRLSQRSIFRAPDGPLWDRSLATGGREASRALTESLRLLGATRMVIGHTPTQFAPRGERGEILLRHAGRLALVDVSLDHGPLAPRTALIIRDGVGVQWTPQGQRVLYRDGA